MGSNIIITDNSRQIMREKDAAIERGLEMIGLQCEGYAKEELSKPKPHADGSIRPNVDTGRLRNSITHATAHYDGVGNYQDNNGKSYSDAKANGKPEKGQVCVGTNVEYAHKIEFGTSKSSAYPYLKPALQNHIREYKDMMKSCLKG